MAEDFPQLPNLFDNAASTRALALGGQNFTRCCMMAMNQSLNVDNGIFIVGSLANLINGQNPCGASYSGRLLPLGSIKCRRQWS